MLFLWSCKNDPSPLHGHWHFLPSKNELFSTLDFENDSMIILNKYGRYPGIPGFVEKKKGRIYFGLEDIKLDFNYQLANGELLLIQNSDTLIAISCAEGCCDKQEDYFADIPLRIDLPMLTDEMPVIDAIPIYNAILIGISKEDQYEFYFGGAIATLQDLSGWDEKMAAKLPARLRGSIPVAIYADKDAPVELLNSVFEHYQQKPGYRVFRAVRGRDNSSGLRVKWLGT